MIPALVSLSLLVTTVICVPVLSPREGTPIAVDVQRDRNDPNDLQPVTTLSPFIKRQVTVVEVIQNDPNDPNNVTPVTTFIQNANRPAPSPTPRPTPQPVTTTPTDTGDDGSDGSDSGSTDGSPLSDGISLLTTINKWRTAYGNNPLTWSDDLAAAALKTGTLDEGDPSKEAHHPAPQAAEVISPGNDNDMGKDLQGHSPFELSYINWLCEVPSDVLGDRCAFQQSIMWT